MENIIGCEKHGKVDCDKCYNFSEASKQKSSTEKMIEFKNKVLIETRNYPMSEKEVRNFLINSI